MKKLIRLILAVVFILLLVRLCSGNLGSVINLPGGLGGDKTEDTGGGWFGPKEKTEQKSSENVPEDIRDLERQLGIGNDDAPSTTTTVPSVPSTTTSSSSPLTFMGIPIAGSLSAFGSELVKAGFKKSLDGSYSGDFAGYTGCKITPVGGDTVQEVRVDFPVISDWDTLEKAYDSLQASLTQKYGIEPKTSSGSNQAVYTLPNGKITLDADVKDRSTWHVILRYANSAAVAASSTIGRNPIDDL
ncbi:MAG: hypothetical protein IJ205_04965 [Bacteroidales bacterium]|nr:hypothetical protein [Bacteroidales bacterium]